MPANTTTRSKVPKTPKVKVKTPPSPTGRMDILASRILDRVVEKQVHDPVLLHLYGLAKPVLEEVTHKALGPRTKTGRQVRKAVVVIRDAALVAVGEGSGAA